MYKITTREVEQTPRESQTLQFETVLLGEVLAHAERFPAFGHVHVGGVVLAVEDVHFPFAFVVGADVFDQGRMARGVTDDEVVALGAAVAVGEEAVRFEDVDGVFDGFGLVEH